jgi:hypothetical protein
MLVNAVIVAAIGLVIFLLHAVPLSQQEPIFASRLADWYLAFAVVLVIASRAYRSDRRWVAMAFVFNVAELVNTLAQLVVNAAKLNAPTDPQLLPPLLLTGVFSLFSGLAYLGMGR